jgi:organic hydroperoxide reductase OsmC/OhrA
MEISATVRHGPDHGVTVSTAGQQQSLNIPAKANGPGSGVNGGELLMLALATCYCNDLYREAQRLGIVLDGVEVSATALFPGIGLAATDIRYQARVSSSAPAWQRAWIPAFAGMTRRGLLQPKRHFDADAGIPTVPGSPGLSFSTCFGSPLAHTGTSFTSRQRSTKALYSGENTMPDCPVDCMKRDLAGSPTS